MALAACASPWSTSAQTPHGLCACYEFGLASRRERHGWAAIRHRSACCAVNTECGSARERGAGRRDVSKMRTFNMGALIVVLGAVACYAMFAYNETVAQRAIVRDVRDLVERCRSCGDEVILVGKALVWDIRSNSRSRAYGKLPASLKAKSGDSPITVFMVIGKKDVQVGTYSVSGEPAYRQCMEIAVAYWPAKRPAGFCSVASAEPRSSRRVEHRPEHGDPSRSIARWIEELRRRNQMVALDTIRHGPDRPGPRR